MRVLSWFAMLVGLAFAREDWHDQVWVKMFQERPFRVAVSTKTGHGQDANLRFAASPRER